MNNALAKILDYKRREVATGKAAKMPSQTQAQARAADPPRGFAAALRAAAEREGVGLDAEMLVAVHHSRPADARLHLVQDEQDIALVADAANLRPVAVGGYDYATGALHGLGNECRHVFRAQLLDASLEVGRRLAPEFLRIEVAALAGSAPNVDGEALRRITRSYLEVRYASHAAGRDELLRELKRFRPGSAR